MWEGGERHQVGQLRLCPLLQPIPRCASRPLPWLIRGKSELMSLEHILAKNHIKIWARWSPNRFNINLLICQVLTPLIPSWRSIRSCLFFRKSKQMPRAKSWHLSLIQTSVLADKSSPKLDLSLSALGIQLLMHDLSGALGLAVILYISKEELVAYIMRQNILYSNAYVLPSLV